MERMACQAGRAMLGGGYELFGSVWLLIYCIMSLQEIYSFWAGPFDSDQTQHWQITHLVFGPYM